MTGLAFNKRVRSDPVYWIGYAAAELNIARFILGRARVTKADIEEVKLLIDSASSTIRIAKDALEGKEGLRC